MLLCSSLPFTREQFINVFTFYGHVMRTIQVFAHLPGMAMMAALVPAPHLTNGSVFLLVSPRLIARFEGAEPPSYQHCRAGVAFMPAFRAGSRERYELPQASDRSS
jgi:hypothetical protein